MLQQHKGSLLHAERQGEATMKQPTAVLIAIIVIAAACTAILAMRKDLCEIHIRSGQTEVAVFMAYESK